MSVLDDILKEAGRDVSRQPSVLNPKPEQPAQPIQPVASATPSAPQPAPSPAVALPKFAEAPSPQVQIKERDARAVEEQTRPLTYVELLHKLNPYQPPTSEEVEKDRRRQRSRETIAAIGDSVRAISNLVATTHYAPNAYKPGESMQGKMRERWDQLQAQRKAESDAYLRAYMQARGADDGNERARVHLQAQREQAQQKFLQDLAKQKDARERWQAELGIKIGDLDRKSKHNEAMLKFQQDRLDETRRHNKASESEARNRTSVISQRISQGKTKDEYYIDLGLDDDGNPLGGVEIAKSAFNDANIAQVYDQIPQEVKDKYVTTERKRGKTITKQPTPQQMRQAIGEHIDDPGVRGVLKRLGTRVGATSANAMVKTPARTTSSATASAPAKKKAYGASTSPAPTPSKSGGKGY